VVGAHKDLDALGGFAMDVAEIALVQARDTMFNIKRLLVLIIACLGLSGCASLSNPVADGIPVARLRPELLAPSKETLEDIPFVLLRRHPVDTYRVAAGDTLGIVIDGILGDSKTFIPVSQGNQGQNGESTPSLGYPIPVRDDGTINVPQLPPIKVDGMSIPEIEDALRKAYTEKKSIVLKEAFSAIVTLYRKRTYHILVIRQDSGGQTTSVSNNTIFGATTVTSSPKRGTGQSLELQFGENDVGTALARTGGMPGTDAINEIVIERSRPETDDPAGPNIVGDKKNVKYVKQFIRIPLRVRPGDKFPYTEDDIILKNGDVVFIAARDADVFFTAGLLGAGQFTLPRDYDIDVLQAIALVRGPLFNGAFSGNNLGGAVLQAGIGSPSPSRLTILRRTAGGGEVRIKVDLNLAARDPRQRPLIQAQDFLILQQSPGEAIVNYLNQTIRFSTLIRAIQTSTVDSNITGTFP
jgi:protein involved in polysaccharide export with SLBB domain